MNARDSSRRTALMFAAKDGKVDCGKDCSRKEVPTLMQQGAMVGPRLSGRLAMVVSKYLICCWTKELQRT